MWVRISDVSDDWHSVIRRSTVLKYVNKKASFYCTLKIRELKAFYKVILSIIYPYKIKIIRRPTFSEHSKSYNSRDFILDKTH